MEPEEIRDASTPSAQRLARPRAASRGVSRFNRFGTMAAVPLMVLAIAILARVNFDRGKATRPDEGVLVVANLRAETLSFIDLRAGANAQTRTLAVPGPPHELATAEGRIYATLGRGNAVAEVEAHGNGVLRSLSIEGEPHGIAIIGGQILVTADRANTLVRIERSSFSETSRTPTGESPHGVAAAGDEIYVVDARANTVEGWTPAGATAAPAGGLPESVAIAGDLVIVANAEGRTVQAFRQAGLEPVATIPVPGRPVRLVTLDGRRVLVTLQDAGMLAVIDVERGRLEERVRTAAQPDGICLSPSGAFVAVASNAADAVQVFRVDSWELVDVVPAGDGPGACAWLPGD